MGSATARPRIAIVPWRRALPTMLGERTVLDALDPAYSDRVVEAGGVPFVVPRPPADNAPDIVEDALAVAAGLLLSGGGDLDPPSYGERSNGEAMDADPEADRWEIELVRAAARRRLPTLGICRGAQVMAVAFGGRLAQRLPDSAGHRDIYGLDADSILAERHAVSLLAGSGAREVYGRDALMVNTIHHNSIADAGELAVAALADGGLIEAVEPGAELAGWPALGVQWHPEKMSEAEQRRPFERLVADAGRYRSAREAG